MTPEPDLPPFTTLASQDAERRATATEERLATASSWPAGSPAALLWLLGRLGVYLAALVYLGLAFLILFVWEEYASADSADPVPPRELADLLRACCYAGVGLGYLLAPRYLFDAGRWSRAGLVTFAGLWVGSGLLSMQHVSLSAFVWISLTSVPALLALALARTRPREHDDLVELTPGKAWF